MLKTIHEYRLHAALTFWLSAVISVQTLYAQTNNLPAGTPSQAVTGHPVDPSLQGASPTPSKPTAGMGPQTDPSVGNAQQQNSGNASPAVLHREPLPAERHAPRNFVEKKNVVVPATGKRALEASGTWASAVNPAGMGKDGRVVFTFGAGMPVIVCAPLRICVIELEPGERIASAPHIGDSVRWDVSLESSGSGDQDTPLIVVKPRDIGLDTSLFVATDRRTYYMRLLSKSDEYTPMVAFEYPDEERAKIQEALQRQEQERELTRINTIPTSGANLFYDYKIRGERSLRPVRVMDDGAKTYIQMPPEIVNRELPTLVIEGPGGKELVNYSRSTM